ncbi:MAG: dTMP kinase [Terracidiphilus sp.]|jgi:dTMP kinase
MPRGLLITLEGLDGSGKTTQIERLAAWLRKRKPRGSSVPEPDSEGRNPGGPGLASETWDCVRGLVITRQPGGTAIGDRIRALLLDSRSAGLASMAEMALMFADRAQAIAEVIQPALDAGKIVLCDRFTDSTEAYQGGGRQLGSAAVLELHRLVCGNLQPDLTLLLLPSLESSLVRARRRNHRIAEQSGLDEGRFESETDAFYRRVWQKYREIAGREPARVVLIEGDLSIEAAHKKIVAAVAERLRKPLT